MTVDITQEELDLFTKNGISQDDIRQTINNYRSDGLSDIDIRAKFDNKLNSFRGQRSGYTYPNQDVKNMNPEEFKRSVDTLYDIPQVPIPQRGTLVNSDGVPMETVADVLSNTAEPSKKTFAQSHPVIASVPETVGTFGRAAKKSYYDFGTGVNDLLTLAGDKTGIKGLSDFGRSNAQFWQQRSGDVDQRINDKYQKLAGLTDASTVLPTIANAIGSQATNLLMAAGGGAGAGTLAKAAGLGKVGTGIATTAGTAVPNLAQEGQYLDKIEAFKNIYGRVPTEEELRVIQNVALGEKATNAALETISDKLLFGKLFPQGVATKGAKDVLKNVGKQAVTEAGTEGMQEGVSIGAENLLGINQGDNLARLGEAIGMGGLTGGILGGGATLASQPYDSQITAEPIEALKEVSAQILDNGKAIYDSANQQSGFDALKQMSKEGAYTNPSVEEIAPNTYQKQQAKKAPVVKNWDIEALPHITSEEAQNVKNWDIDALPRVKSVEEQIAPKTVAKQQTKALEKAEKAESNYEQVMEEARKHTIKTGEQTRVTKNDNGMYEYEVVKPEVANVDAKIAELERKMKIVGGEKTQLGQKYKRQIEEMRGTEQAVAPVSEEIKSVENVPSKTEEAIKPVETEEVVAPESVEPSEEIQVAEIEGFEKDSKSTEADENRHQKVIDLEDKAYKEFKTMYDNYINGDVKISDFGKAKEQFNKKYKKEFEKLNSDRFTSFEDLAKRENKDITETTETTNPAEVQQVTEAQEVGEKPKKTPKNTEKSTKTIEDSGEFLLGNRKIDKSLTWNDLDEMNDLVRAKNTTKAKIYAAPKFEDLKTEGYSDFGASLIINVYKKINAKPAAGYTGKEYEKLYVDMVNDTMKTVKDYIKNNPEKFTDEVLAERTGSINPYSYHYKSDDSLFEAVFPDKENKKGYYFFRHYPEYNRKSLIVGGSKFNDSLRIDYHTLKDVSKIIEESKALKDKKTGEKVKKQEWEKTFTVLEPSRWDNRYAVAFKKGKQIIAKFNSKAEAELVAQRAYEKLKQQKENEKSLDSTRKHIERRKDGRDVTAQELKDEFGFRGVNFGNWVNQKERQSFTNNTYDALFDLAEMLNLPNKALSLNGELGIAFGAQGHGGKAAAHYIPAFKEINLTKEHGAGSLAHEWWHAVDNYFGNKASNKEFSESWGISLKQKGEVREEVFNALKDLHDQIKTSPLTEEDLAKYAKYHTDRINGNINRYAEHIKNSYRRAKNTDELNKIIDDLANNREKYKDYSIEQMNEFERKFFKLLPENRDTLTNRGEFSWLTGEIRRLARVEELAKGTAKKSEYLKSAEKLDKQEGTKYWSEDTELGARAFSVWLLDKMEKQSILNRFLVRQEHSAMTIDEATFKKLLEGKEDSLDYIHKTPIVTEEKARIFKAFDKLFDTIKTRETEKGVELYSIDIPEFMKNSKVVDNGLKDIELSPIFDSVKKGISGAELAKILPKELGDIVMQRASKYKFTEMITKGKELGVNRWKRSVIELNLKAIGNSPKKFVNTLMHEVKHAEQYKLYLDIMGKPKNSWTFEERSFIAKYNICKSVNKKRNNFYNRHRDLCDRFEKNNFYSAEERNEAIAKLSKKEQDIIDQNDKNLLEYLKADFEAEARAEGIRYDKDYKTKSGYRNRTLETLSSNNGTKGKWTLGTNSRSGFASVSDTKYRQKAKQSVEQTVRDKVYDWHGGIGKDRYDVDKTLNSFIRMSKNIAKDISQKTGLKVSDKQLREMLPFLRERTNIPEKLDRDDLKKIFNALSGEEKARLVKFADDTSNKFEKYYKNYLNAKGEVDEASIKNHISHIWDLDDKKQALLTNYITTKSRFAKQRTIETLAKGINGIEIDGKIVEFKPKTLDYAEILKSSSDNLIKATYDMQLAETIKGMKDADGKPLVLPAHKAPADWIEVSHPALNKAVYMGTVGEDELPMLMKSSVKVHPDLEKYVASIFETPKTSSKFWKGYDSINGILKQTQLGFSGFHGYALSESALANMGVKKTLDSLNVKKVYDAVKNGNYEIYEHEAEAKRAIDAGVQLGTPSDLNRNLVEETLNKIPVLGKYISGAVSVNNKILWDVLHNNFKLFTFNAKIAELEKAGKVTKEQERAVAQWVNDTYGGQSWELLGVKNSDVRKAGRVLLSPDWNFSTVRQALGSINNAKLDKVFNDTKAWKRVAELMGVSENIGGEGVRGKIARDFWIRAVVYSTIFYNAMNAAFRADDREKHPERYPKNMKPFDYSIWANANPMDNWYEKMMPYVFIGRNSDGTARMLRVGKQFREVPELAADPITKLSGKSASIIGLLTQVAVGMSPADIVKKVSGREAYLNQNIWEGYGEDARMRDGIEAVTGRLKVAAKGAAPFMLSKYLDGKHEPSAWDMFAQTSVGSTKGKVYKEAKEAFEAGREDKIREIKQKAYRDGVRKEDINKMVGYAEKNYKADNTKKYRKKFVEAMKNKDKKELNRIKSDMQRHHLSAKEQRRIYESAYKKYLQER